MTWVVDTCVIIDLFKYVKDDKTRRIERHGASPDAVDDDYEYVGDNDVVVH